MSNNSYIENSRPSNNWIDILSSPQVYHGLLNASYGILSPGGNIGDAFGGFSKGMMIGEEVSRRNRQEKIDSIISQMKLQQAVKKANSPRYVPPGGTLLDANDNSIIYSNNNFNKPSVIQVANKIQELRDKGDTRGLNDLLLSMKALPKGIQENEVGEYQPVSGYSEAITKLEKADQIGKGLGKEQAITEEQIADMESRMPQLNKLVEELDDLGKKASYTIAGQFINSVRKETGMSTTKAGIARAAYTAKLSNEILPLLRQTFGSQFTEKEGESLKATLGDPNMSPTEKTAVLKAFIETKKQTIASLRRKRSIQSGNNTIPQQGIKWRLLE